MNFNNMNVSREIGDLGEKIAVKYLASKGYQILDRNFLKKVGSLKFGEIDIVAQKDGVVSFFEVKALTGAKDFSPEQKVDFRKTEKIRKTAEIWLDKHGTSLDSQWQIDVLAIVLDFNLRKAKIRHFKNI